MNSFNKIFFIFIVLFVFYAPGALAYKRAIFPDSTKLQPMPADVAPNISGNVNSQLDSSLLNQNLSDSNLASEENASSSATNKSASKNSSSENTSDKNNFIWFVAVVIFLVIAFVYAFKGNGVGKK